MRWDIDFDVSDRLQMSNGFRSVAMLITRETYRFAPPNSEAGIIIRSFRELDAAVADKCVYELEVPQELQDFVCHRYKCEKWTDVVRTLAGAFCKDNEDLAASLINR